MGAPPRTEPPAPAAAGAPPLCAAEIVARVRQENFAVASRLLPAREREGLLGIYSFARLVDQLGDDLNGDREGALDWLEGELARLYAGQQTHPLLRPLARTVAHHPLPQGPFLRLIAANRTDQRKHRYRTFEELLAYCDLSANPVGELVLHLFGQATPKLLTYSNLICSALQIVEHLQDVGEDYRRGRIYLPAEDRARFGVGEEELGAPFTSPALRELLAYEGLRARALLYAGEPLLAALRGSARFAVAGYLAGGHGALDRLQEANYEVLGAAPRPKGGRRLLLTASLLGRSAAGHLGRGPLALCADLTRARAANFYWGIRLLDFNRQRALCAVYAFARLVDDIADGELGRERKLARLAEVEGLLKEGLGGRLDPLREPVLAGVAVAARRQRLPLEDLFGLLEGVRMDVEGVSFGELSDLLRYCDRVASTVGRLSLAIYGLKRPQAGPWAQAAASDLGVALQLTNILRDLREDAERGRLYLPRALLDRYGLLAEGEGALLEAVAKGSLAGPQRRYLAALVGEFAREANRYFERGLSLVDQLDRQSAACVLAMASIYRATLRRIERDPLLPLDGRLALPSLQKAGLALASLVRLTL